MVVWFSSAVPAVFVFVTARVNVSVASPVLLTVRMYVLFTPSAVVALAVTAVMLTSHAVKLSSSNLAHSVALPTFDTLTVNPPRLTVELFVLKAMTAL